MKFRKKIIKNFLKKEIIFSVYILTIIFTITCIGEGIILDLSPTDEVEAYKVELNTLIFLKQDITTVADGANSVHAADIDDDGDIDIVSNRTWNSQPLELWENLSNPGRGEAANNK